MLGISVDIEILYVGGFSPDTTTLEHECQVLMLAVNASGDVEVRQSSIGS
jgi:hypothetical protein